MGRKKRSRNSQPGNQNALKHGFYAANLSPGKIHKTSSFKIPESLKKHQKRASVFTITGENFYKTSRS